MVANSKQIIYHNQDLGLIPATVNTVGVNMHPLTIFFSMHCEHTQY